MWSTISRNHYFKQNLAMKIRVELTDRSGLYKIEAHDEVIIFNYYKFEDYWLKVENISHELELYFDDDDNEISYSRLYVYFIK